MQLESLKLGAKIAALRKARGMTQEQLADQLGVSAPAVSKWETDSSYPDITLLCPLARALGINVDTLLQFEPSLSDDDVTARINEIVQCALAQGVQAAEEHLQALLHRYPNCTTLQFHAATAYDAFAMFFPTADEQAHWRERKRHLLEQVRASGDATYWSLATLQLASLSIVSGALEQAEHLLSQLPAHTGDPTLVRVHLHLKREQREQALNVLQRQLYKSTCQVQRYLLMLASPQLMLSPEKGVKAIAAYKTIAAQFGLLDLSDGPLSSIYQQQGEWEQAANCLVRLVDAATGSAVYPDADLFCPGLSFEVHPEQCATTRELRQMLYQGLSESDEYRALTDIPAFQKALDRLKASL